MWDKSIKHAFKVLWKKLVCFVKAQNFAVIHVGDFFLHQIEDSPGGGHYQMDLKKTKQNFVKSQQILAQAKILK